MTEAVSPSPDEIPAAYEGIADPRLTPEEVAALTEREDHGIQAVPMREFENLDDFEKGENNFHLMFTAKPGGIAWYLNRGKKAFQRFAILHPELEASVTEKVQGKGVSQFSKDDWQALFESYGEIAKFVDINDAGPDRKVDKWFLCR